MARESLQAELYVLAVRNNRCAPNNESEGQMGGAPMVSEEAEKRVS